MVKGVIGDILLGCVIGGGLMFAGMVIYRTYKADRDWRKNLEEEWKAAMIKRGNDHDCQIAELFRRVRALEREEDAESWQGGCVEEEVS